MIGEVCPGRGIPSEEMSIILIIRCGCVRNHRGAEQHSFSALVTFFSKGWNFRLLISHLHLNCPPVVFYLWKKNNLLIYLSFCFLLGGAREVASRTNVQIVLIFSLSHFDHFFHIVIVWREGDPRPGPKSGLLSNAQKWIVRGDTRTDKARGFIGKRNPGGELQGKGTQENCFVALLFSDDGVSFWVVSGQSFWLMVNPCGTRSPQPRWIPVRRILGDGRNMVSPFDLSQILPVAGGLLVPCSLPGPSIVK